VIFCENVKGLKIHDKGNTYKIIKGAIEDIGYKVFEDILNSKDFGVPQNRERIYIVAFRDDLAPAEFDFSTLAEQYKQLHNIIKEPQLKDIIEKKTVSVKYYLSTVYLETLRKHKERHAAKGNGFGYEVRKESDIAGAIVCGGMGRERNLIIDKRLKDFTPQTHIKGEVNREGIRKMTPREWARLQGFPDDFDFPVSDVHSYKQLGNSVTVPVIESIAKKIRDILIAPRNKRGK
jgi:DNA (cytosine-5)-methyltransferase 1